MRHKYQKHSKYSILKWVVIRNLITRKELQDDFNIVQQTADGIIHRLIAEEYITLKFVGKQNKKFYAVNSEKVKEKMKTIADIMCEEWQKIKAEKVKKNSVGLETNIPNFSTYRNTPNSVGPENDKSLPELKIPAEVEVEKQHTELAQDHSVLQTPVNLAGDNKHQIENSVGQPLRFSIDWNFDPIPIVPPTGTITFYERQDFIVEKVNKVLGFKLIKTNSVDSDLWGHKVTAYDPYLKIILMTCDVIDAIKFPRIQELCFCAHKDGWEVLLWIEEVKGVVTVIPKYTRIKKRTVQETIDVEWQKIKEERQVTPTEILKEDCRS